MLFADGVPIPSGEHAVTLGTLGTLMVGIVAWVLKSALPAMLRQHRDDIFQLHKECRDERVADQTRHNGELAERDERLNGMMQTLIDLARVKGQDKTDPKTQ